MSIDKICKLCRVSAADKTGSHIISHFILNNLLSTESKGRNREIFITRGESGLATTYFGREVLPEKYDELLGRQLTEEEIKANVNPEVIDNLLCSSCEDKLQRLEDIIAKNIYQNFNRIVIKKHDGASYKDLEAREFYLFKFFFFSIVWRVAVTKQQMNINLVPVFEEKIRELLVNNLSLNPEQLQKNVETSKSEIESHPLIIFCQEDTNNGNSKTGNFVNFHPTSQTPYYATINEFIICFYYKINSKGKPFKNQAKYFGIEEFLKKGGFDKIDNQKALRVLSKDEWESFRKNLINFRSVEILTNLRSDFTTIFQRRFNYIPSPQIVEGYMQKLILENQNQYDKFTITNVVKVMYEYFESLHKT